VYSGSYRASLLSGSSVIVNRCLWRVAGHRYTFRIALIKPREGEGVGANDRFRSAAKAREDGEGGALSL